MERAQKQGMGLGAVGGALDASSSLTDSGYANTTGLTEDSGAEELDLEAMQARVREMEEEAERLRALQSEMEKQFNPVPPTPTVVHWENLDPIPPTPAVVHSTFPSQEEKMEADGRSVYVGNVDYGATAEEVERHFHHCGTVNRVTIQCDKFTGHPKGFAYIEFAHKDCVTAAVTLDGSVLRGRQIKVNPKRTNRPGISSTNRGRGRARGAGGDRGRGGTGGHGRGVYNGASYNGDRGVTASYNGSGRAMAANYNGDDRAMATNYNGGDRGVTASYGGDRGVAAGYGGDRGVTAGYGGGAAVGYGGDQGVAASYNAGQASYGGFVPGGYAEGFTPRTRPAFGHARGRANLCS